MERTSIVKVSIIEYFADLEEIYGMYEVIDFEDKMYDLYKKDRVSFEEWAEDNDIELDDESLEMWTFIFEG